MKLKKHPKDFFIKNNCKRIRYKILDINEGIVNLNNTYLSHTLCKARKASFKILTFNFVIKNEPLISILKRK